MCTHNLCLDGKAKIVNNLAVYRFTHGIILKIVGNEGV